MTASVVPAEESQQSLQGVLRWREWSPPGTRGIPANWPPISPPKPAGLPRISRRGRACSKSLPGRVISRVEIGRLGPYRITGLDISRSFVRIASEHAAKSGFDIEFLEGDAAAMPFADDTFDFIVCRAAFKNFAEPAGAMREMYRVLNPGGAALIIDMRGDTSNAALDGAVDDMHLSMIGGLMTRIIFRQLRNRAYAKSDIQKMAAATPFGSADISETPIGFDTWLRK